VDKKGGIHTRSSGRGLTSGKSDVPVRAIWPSLEINKNKCQNKHRRRGIWGGKRKKRRQDLNAGS